MIDINNLTIGDAREIAALVSNVNIAPKPSSLGRRIVVLDRGFVFVGDVVIDGDIYKISAAQNIRVWGTTRGLGELAVNGPTNKTQLDPAGDIEAPARAVIFTMKIEALKWV